jgi:hypothetical protein
MRLREDETLTPEAERELEALEAALAGRPVDPELAELAELARELRAERPRPRTEFSAELDERAGAGFPRSGAAGRVARLRERLATTPPRRVLAPAGAAVTVLVVAGVAISQSGLGEREDGPAVAPIGLEREGGELAEPPQAAPPEDATGVAPAGGGAEETAEETLEPAQGPDATVPPFRSPPPGPRPGIAPGQEDRKVERAAQLTLSADTDEVPDVADDVIEVTDRFRGIVISSQVSGENGDRARAHLELAIPAIRLDDALRDLSDLADVEARSESSLDITAPFVSARERLADARAELERLLQQLAEADTPAETASIRQRMEIVRGEIARARAEVQSVARRARFARVSVTVEGGGGSGGWSFEDAAEDALDVLGFTVKVALVSLAVLVPLALLGTLAFLAGGSLVRRSRERALDESAG